MSESKEEKSKKSALIAFDFDLTITSKHIHNILAKGFLADAPEEVKWQAVKDIKPRGSAEEWNQAFQTLIAAGQDLSIVTENKHLDLIRRYLKEIIGLNDKTLEAIYIDNQKPSHSEPGKNGHLKRAKQHYSRNEDDRNVILVEDSLKNIQTAQKVGLLHRDYGAVSAPTDDYSKAPHIKQVLEISQKFAPKIEIKEVKKALYGGFYPPAPPPSSGNPKTKTPNEPLLSEQGQTGCWPCKIL